MLRCPIAATLLASLLLVGATPLAAQQEFTLTEQDAWVTEDEIDLSTPDGQLQQIRKTYAEGRFDRAERASTIWIERYTRHPLLPEAHVIRGDSHRARGDFYDALLDYEFVARSFPGSEAFVLAVQREFEIARMYATGTRRKFLGMRIMDASDEAEELLILVQQRMPGSRVAEQAGITLSDFYFERREMSLAIESYTLFIENYPRSEYITRARRRLIFAHLASFKGPEFEVTGMLEARAQLETLKAVEPSAAEKLGADALLIRIHESVAMKMFTSALWYVQTSDYIGAEFMIRRLMRTYPRTVAAVEALKTMRTIVPELPASVAIEAVQSGVYPMSLFGLESPEPAAVGTEATPPTEDPGTGGAT